jgi:hypothetical protein
LTDRDRRLVGYDAAALVEVIEHFDPPRPEAIEANVFGWARPGCVEGERRHPDHRFEWTRAEFASWASRVGVA